MSSGSNNDVQASHQLIHLLERAKSNTESLIDELPDLFCIINREGKILKGNSELAKLLKTTQELLVKKGLWELFSNRKWPMFLTYLSSVQEDQRTNSSLSSLEFEFGVDGVAGPERTIIWSVKPFSKGNTRWEKLYNVTGRDISISVVLERKNRELEYQKGRSQAVINSSNHGFFTFNKNLTIEGDFSEKAKELLGNDIAGKNVCQVLNLSEVEFVQFAKMAFQGDKWEAMKTVSTRECLLQEKILRVEFMPVRESGVIERILGIVTDITAYRALQKREEANRKANAAIAKILKSKSIFLSALQSVKLIEGQLEDATTLARTIHTLKGEFGFFECTEWVQVCHNWESSWKKQPGPGNNQKFLLELKSAIKKFIDEYNTILNLENSDDETLLIPNSSIKEFMKEASSLQLSAPANAAFLKALSVPPRKYFDWLDDVWMMSADRLKKQVEHMKWGSSINIFLEPYKPLFRTLIHLVRNSVDHGIELPDERSAAGKPRKGSLLINLTESEGQYLLTLRDDGRGVDLEKVRAVAQQRNIPVPGTDEECLDLLFSPEFSLSPTVNELSGRGVGLSVIRHEAQLVGGEVKAVNYPGKGFELQIRFRKYAFSSL